ncbi:MAG: FHA domain-containing protein, partial [Chloroflexales bacterium]|nr:FHA domain-containing protein [Chloroflexales bacterium]
REALARAQAGLAALGVSAPTVAAPTPVAPVAPVTPVAPVAPVAPAAPRPAPATGPRLVVVDGGAVLTLPADKAEIIVGREDPVSNIFPEVDLTPFGGEMGGVSRQHAKITNSGGQWLITDLNSTNYTRLDGTRLEPNSAMPLHDGARVQFGRIVVTFHL